MTGVQTCALPILPENGLPPGDDFGDEAEEKSRHGAGDSWDSVLAPHLAPAQRRRLAEARVGIAGAGGLGSNCAVLLARSGVGRLTIADHDVVSLSNLNRQFYWPRHLGRPKVDALGEILRDLNGAIRLDLRRERLEAGTVGAVFAGCSVVVEAVDGPDIKRELVEALLRAGHTVVSASGMAGWGGPPDRKSVV